MPHRGTFYAITPDEAERLLALVGNDAEVAREALDLHSFERQRARFIAAVDKAWDPIHRCLTDGTLRDLGKGATPLSWCILGGKSLHAGKEFIVCYVTPEQVSQVAQALDEIEPQWLIQRYRNLESSGYTGLITNEDFDYAWENFTNVRNLYSKAAAATRAMVFVAD
ncbi:MAG: DUF1877 family protein [Tepidisphaeraceae bacterium]|jgi:uncharacterized protein DUF1877